MKKEYFQVVTDILRPLLTITFALSVSFIYSLSINQFHSDFPPIVKEERFEAVMIGQQLKSQTHSTKK